MWSARGYEGWIELNGTGWRARPTRSGYPGPFLGTRRHDNDGIEKTQGAFRRRSRGSQSVYLWAPINFVDRVFLLARTRRGRASDSTKRGRGCLPPPCSAVLAPTSGTD